MSTQSDIWLVNNLQFVVATDRREERVRETERREGERNREKRGVRETERREGERNREKRG